MPPPLLDLLSRAAMYSPKVESSLCSRAASSPVVRAPSLAPADPRVSLPAGRVVLNALLKPREYSSVL